MTLLNNDTSVFVSLIEQYPGELLFHFGGILLETFQSVDHFLIRKKIKTETNKQLERNCNPIDHRYVRLNTSNLYFDGNNIS